MAMMTKIIDTTEVDGKTKVTLTSMLYPKPRSMVLNMSLAEYTAAMIFYQNGVLIQNAFPQLNADEREFLMTGIKPEEWDDITGEEGQ